MSRDVGDITNPRASAAKVEAFGVYREFNGRTVVNDLTLTVSSGTIHGLLGPNGAGKTTVLRMVAGLMAPTEGWVTVVDGDPRDRIVRGKIGWVPASDRSFYHRLSGRQNLVFFGQLHGMPREDAVDTADRWIAAVSLDEAASRPVRTYSHGMIKRLLIARALMCDPQVLVVDEATHDLDPKGADQIRDLVKQSAQGGAAVLWATQRLTELRGFAESVTVLGSGDVRFSGSVDDLAAHAGGQSYLIRLDTRPDEDSAEVSGAQLHRIERSDTWRLSVREYTTLTDVLHELGTLGLRVVSCSEERSDVELAFLRLTGSEQTHS